MARSWTLAQIRLRAKRAADMENSTFVSDPEWQDIINAELCEVYDMLVQAGPPDYYSVTQGYTTVAGTLAYALPADFRSATVCYAKENVDQRRPLLEINDYRRAWYRPPQAAYNLELEYVPAPPTLVSDSDTFDGVSGWEELIVAMSARDALMKEESDLTQIEGKIANLKGRIKTASSQRGAGPQYITDVDSANVWLYPSVVKVRAMRIRGDNIEFYEPSVPLP